LTEVRKRQLAWVAGISAVIALLAVWTFAIDWEWSYIGDDAGWVGTVRSAVEAGSPLTPLIQAPAWAWGEAVGWGLFRPTSITYYALIYQLDVRGAHLIRAIMYLVAVVAPLVIAFRVFSAQFCIAQALWLLALGLANYTMIYGIYFVSLSELTAIFLVAIALLIKQPTLKVILFLLAALAKAPFIWLTFMYSLYLMRNPETRKSGSLGVGLGIASLGAIVYASQSGSYGENLAINPWHFFKNVELLGTYGAPFLFILLLGIFLFVSSLRTNAMTWVLLIGAALFAGNMLAWNTIGYYNAPIWFLLTCAVATAIMPSSKDAQPQTSRWAVPVMAGCLVASGLLAAETFRTDVFGRNQMVVEARDWYLSQRSVGTRLLMGNINPADFNFILTEHDPRYRDSLDSYVDETTGFVLVMNDWSYPPEIDECPPIKVWTKGFLAPLKC